MLIEFMKPDFTFQNECGRLVQLVREGWKQINVIQSVQGSVRGGHYHKYNREGFYVATGSFKLIVWMDAAREEYELGEGDMFVIPPNVFHTFAYAADTCLVGMYDRGVEMGEDQKDIWTE